MSEQKFDWPLAYDAEILLRDRMTRFLERNAFARQLARRIREETGTDFFEWMDHLVLPASEERALGAVGFERDANAPTPSGIVCYEHPRATLPRILLTKQSKPLTVAIKPEFVADFSERHNLSTPIEGEPRSRYRRLLVAEENGTRLEAVERRAYLGFFSAPLKAGETEAIASVEELWRSRRRDSNNESDGFAHANELLDQAIEGVGRDVACHLFFEAERAYWQSRNRAGQIQKQRQDALGLGWGNHDHHTFRCSRGHFAALINFLMQLGFEKRERFYAGAEAGWGAQISEHRATGVVVFADVDLMPDETQIDFSSKPLPPASRLGTVGLWCALHGESFLEAGMHHLEARFEFPMLRDQLRDEGIATMKPFSDFEFLRQAFTEAERWPVRRERLEKLLAARLITPDQANQFLAQGALGSHLENLQRHGGFKGFNQKSVSAIISAVDPRKHLVPAEANA